MMAIESWNLLTVKMSSHQKCTCRSRNPCLEWSISTTSQSFPLWTDLWPAQKQDSEPLSFAIQTIMMPDIGVLKTGITTVRNVLRDLKKLLQTLMRPPQLLLAVKWEDMTNKALRKFQTFAVKSTLSITTHKSRLMCRGHGCTSRTQVFVLLTMESLERTKSICTTMPTHFLSEKEFTLQRSSQMRSVLSAICAVISLLGKQTKPLQESEGETLFLRTLHVISI